MAAAQAGRLLFPLIFIPTISSTRVNFCVVCILSRPSTSTCHLVTSSLYQQTYLAMGEAKGGPHPVAPYTPPIQSRLITIVLSLLTLCVLAVCLTRRVQSVRRWDSLPLPTWLIIAIYIDSFLFIFFTAVLSKSWMLSEDARLCDAAILLCLSCYLTTKVLIYYYFVEKAYIVRGSRRSRLRDKLYLFNFFGVICPYLVVIVLNFYL